MEKITPGNPYLGSVLFAEAGPAVAILTTIMLKRLLSALPVALFCTHPLLAQDWSLGVSTGPFVFGHFAERKIRVGTEIGSSVTTITTSAATRPGLSVDLEHVLTPALSVRLGGTFTEAPLSVRSRRGDNSVSLDAGKIDVGTFALPLIWNINRSGAFRFHLGAGPAYALYHIRRQTGGTPLFEGTRPRWGAVAQGGVAFQWSHRFAVEGAISDVVTSSPLNRDDFPAGSVGLDIPRPNNIHTTVGVRYRF